MACFHWVPCWFGWHHRSRSPGLLPGGYSVPALATGALPTLDHHWRKEFEGKERVRLLLETCALQSHVPEVAGMLVPGTVLLLYPLLGPSLICLHSELQPSWMGLCVRPGTGQETCWWKSWTEMSPLDPSPSVARHILREAGLHGATLLHIWERAGTGMNGRMLCTLPSGAIRRAARGGSSSVTLTVLSSSLFPCYFALEVPC